MTVVDTPKKITKKKLKNVQALYHSVYDKTVRTLMYHLLTNFTFLKTLWYQQTHSGVPPETAKCAIPAVESHFCQSQDTVSVIQAQSHSTEQTAMPADYKAQTDTAKPGHSVRLCRTRTSPRTWHHQQIVTFCSLPLSVCGHTWPAD